MCNLFKINVALHEYRQANSQHKTCVPHNSVVCVQITTLRRSVPTATSMSPLSAHIDKSTDDAPLNMLTVK